MTAEPTEPAGIEVCGRCRQVRPRRVLTRVPAAAGEPPEWRCTEPCKGPGGRPPIGGRFLITWPDELRAGVEALSLPGETLAATARRLLAAAVAAAAVEDQDQQPADLPACPDCGGPRSLCRGDVAMCGQCGGIFDLAAGFRAAAEPGPAGHAPGQRARRCRGGGRTGGARGDLAR